MERINRQCHITAEACVVFENMTRKGDTTAGQTIDRGISRQLVLERLCCVTYLVDGRSHSHGIILIYGVTQAVSSTHWPPDREDMLLVPSESYELASG